MSPHVANLGKLFAASRGSAEKPRARTSLGVLLSKSKKPLKKLFSYGQDEVLSGVCKCGQGGALLKAERMPPTKRYVLANEKPTQKRVKKVFSKWAPLLARKMHSAITKVDLRGVLRKITDDEQKLVDRILAQIDLNGYSIELIEALREDLLEAFKAGGASGLDLIGMQNDATITSLVNEQAVVFARDRAAALVGMKWSDEAGAFIDNPNALMSISETTRESLRGIFVTALGDGSSTDDIAAEIQDSFGFSDARAEMIARTELANAHVQGNLNAWDESGQVSGKESILADTHPEEDVCDENEAAGVVDLSEPFPSGEQGPPYHPNCLCDVLPVLSEEKNDS